MKSIFLDWNRPLLPATVDYFFRHSVRENRLDLRNIVLALPGRRAINRLEELFAERVEQLADVNKLEPNWYPPRFLTLGSLPECFYERTKPIADDMTQRLAWIQVIDRMEEENPDLLNKILPHPPKHSDLEARLALGKMFAALHRELAADALDFSDVVKYCTKLKIENEADRWRALDKLQQKYLALLDKLEVWDLQSARLFAINNQQPEEYQRIIGFLTGEKQQFYLVGLVDMNGAQRKILKKFEKFVTPLVFAPESLSDRFDEFGCLIPDQWRDTQIDLAEDQVEIVQTPSQQADAVLRKFASLNKRFSAEEIVIGVPDPQVISFVQQKLKQAEIPSRHFEGVSMPHTAVYRFLDILTAFIESKSFASFTELLRHPDVEDFLLSPFREQRQFIDLLSELDKYGTKYLPLNVDGNWRHVDDVVHSTKKQSESPLPKIWDRFLKLFENDKTSLDSLTEERPAKVWTKYLRNILTILFETKNDDLTKKTFALVSEALKTLENLPSELLQKISLVQTIRLLLLLIRSENIPPHDISHAIELIGWLEIVMDDAPVAIVTGMNDGFVPSFSTSDLFLPDKIRQHLGLEDNRRRFARDAYSLSVILATRNNFGGILQGQSTVHLIGGRRSAGDDPMLPSRLFFLTDNKTVASRIERFFPKQTPPDRPIEIKRTKTTNKKKNTYDIVPFQIPKPISLDDLNSGKPKYMRVTEFADYIKCPYRYYLKNRLNLSGLDDSAEELDGGAFGTLIHDVLNHLKEFDETRMHDAEEIRIFLVAELSRYVLERYGKTPRPAVSIQIERAKERIRTFSRWQADWFNEGNRIIATEYSFNEFSAGGGVFLNVPNAPDGKMYLRGRIDRIDFNIKTKRLIVLDYKTSDSAKDPEDVHRKQGEGGEKNWIDLQLPLYHYIMRRSRFGSDYVDSTTPEEIGLGYVVLPKDVDKTGIRLAKWNLFDIDQAIEKAKTIVRCICNNEFKITEPPPKYCEQYAAICLDNIIK